MADTRDEQLSRWLFELQNRLDGLEAELWRQQNAKSHAEEKIKIISIEIATCKARVEDIRAERDTNGKSP